MGAAERPRRQRTERERRLRMLARRRAVRRRRLTLLGVIALGATVIALALSAGGSPAAPSRGGSRARLSSASAHTGQARRPAHHRPLHRSPSPGSLPQTHAYPSGTSARFRSLMAALWSGIVHDSVHRALPAFFPEQAYAQLKAISDASADWQDRLVHDYGLDIGAAHALLGRGAPTARLLAVDVPSSYGHWIVPGVCYNSIGYYEMPNARIVYREDGAVRSFGIASMISWRGVWYVVHLGAILRNADVGMVDDPSAGPGASAYSGTC